MSSQVEQEFGPEVAREFEIFAEVVPKSNVVPPEARVTTRGIFLVVTVALAGVSKTGIRKVWIPLTLDGKAVGPIERTEEQMLEGVFRYGQNDFQPQEERSVSVGDVVHWREGRRFLVEPCGFKELSRGEWIGERR